MYGLFFASTTVLLASYSCRSFQTDFLRFSSSFYDFISRRFPLVAGYRRPLTLAVLLPSLPSSLSLLFPPCLPPTKMPLGPWWAQSAFPRLKSRVCPHLSLPSSLLISPTSSPLPLPLLPSPLAAGPGRPAKQACSVCRPQGRESVEYLS